jgi:AraC family transcriptional regulator
MRGSHINSPGVLINPPANLLGSVNAVYSGESRHHLVENYVGPLSLKAMISGSALWHTEAGAQRVQAASFLVLNKGTKYTLEMNSPKPSRTFVLFFRDGFVEDIRRSLTDSSDTLLDNPFGAASSVQFIEAIHSVEEPAVGNALARVRRVWMNGGDALALEEEFRGVALELLSLQNKTTGLLSAWRSMRPATKNELFRRAQRARVLIEDSFQRDLSLEDLAQEACLSPFHFHRTFRSIYGITPHGYVQRLRLRLAARLLCDTELPVASVCAKSGFGSVPSFYNLFRSRFRMPPSRFRSVARKSKIR